MLHFIRRNITDQTGRTDGRFLQADLSSMWSDAGPRVRFRGRKSVHSSEVVHVGPPFDGLDTVLKLGPVDMHVIRCSMQDLSGQANSRRTSRSQIRRRTDPVSFCSTSAGLSVNAEESRKTDTYL